MVDNSSFPAKCTRYSVFYCHQLIQVYMGQTTNLIYQELLPTISELARSLATQNIASYCANYQQENRNWWEQRSQQKQFSCCYSLVGQERAPIGEIWRKATPIKLCESMPTPDERKASHTTHLIGYIRTHQASSSLHLGYATNTRAHTIFRYSERSYYCSRCKKYLDLQTW